VPMPLRSAAARARMAAPATGKQEPACVELHLALGRERAKQAKGLLRRAVPQKEAAALAALALLQERLPWATSLVLSLAVKAPRRTAKQKMMIQRKGAQRVAEKDPLELWTCILRATSHMDHGTTHLANVNAIQQTSGLERTACFSIVLIGMKSLVSLIAADTAPVSKASAFVLQAGDRRLVKKGQTYARIQLAR